MSDSVRPHRWQPTRLLCPWDSPGKNTGVGCHFLLQCMKVKSESEVVQATSNSWHFQGLVQALPPFLTLFSPSGDSTFLQLRALAMANSFQINPFSLGPSSEFWFLYPSDCYLILPSWWISKLTRPDFCFSLWYLYEFSSLLSPANDYPAHHSLQT